MLDMHIHTDDSPDAEIPAAELVRLGRKAGLTHMGFVAHLDLNPDDYCHGGFSREGYDESFREALREAEEGVTVMKGLEVGEPHVYQEKVREIADYSDYDFITGALHSVRGAGMILVEEAFEDGDHLEKVELYYEETLKMVETAEMDILAHLGIFRRGMALAGAEYDLDAMELWPETVQRILRVLIDRGIALELNTAGLRRREGLTYPSLSVLSRYHDLGGTLLTIGSDTHRENHLFYGLKEGRKLLAEIGFSNVYCYVERKPIPSGLFS